MKVLFTILACYLAINAYSQDGSYAISDPIDIPQTGWNKLLQMSNGNTILFHFEERKGIVVKIFDSTHKEIASHKHICKVFDINRQDHADVKGFYEMNGEVALFLEQNVWNKNSLILLRINPTDASLIEEKTLLQSPGLSRAQSYMIRRENGSANYWVFCSEDIAKNPEDKEELVEFNYKHEQIKKVVLNISGKNYDKFRYLGFNVGVANDIYLTLELSKTKVSGVRPVYDNFLVINYLPQGTSQFSTHIIPLSADASPIYTRFSEIDTSIFNVIMVDAKPTYYDYGINSGISVDMNSAMLMLNKTNWLLAYQWLAKQKLNAKGDSSGIFHGIPIKMYTDNEGNINIVYEEYITYTAYESGRKIIRTDLGYIGIAKYDKTGRETWGITLPKQQSMRTHFFPGETLNRGISKALFRHLPEQEYEDQFGSISVYPKHAGLFIFYNDFAANFNNTADNPGTVVTQDYHENAFLNTDAFYYKMKENGEITKNYLFGPSIQDNSKSNMLESGDFNDKTNTYATIILDRKGKKINTCIAWCLLN